MSTNHLDRLRANIAWERLREVLSYDPDTGMFTWLVSLSNNKKVGSVAGCPNGNGYIFIKVDGTRYYAHRLAWFYMTGEWPKYQVDHRDLDRSNNRWVNLRDATSSQNKANSKPRKSASGLKGVEATPFGTFSASISVNRKKKHLGTYRSREEAHAVYCEAAKKYYGEFGRGF